MGNVSAYNFQFVNGERRLGKHLEISLQNTRYNVAVGDDYS